MSKTQLFQNINPNPNFIYQKTISDLIHNDQYDIDNAFDIYSLLENENNIYLAGSNDSNPSQLSIYLFEKVFIHKFTLNGHSDYISSCKYFCNLNNKKEYLISSSYSISESKEIIIWSILKDNNYKNIFKIKSKVEIHERIKFLLITNNNNEDFLIYSLSELNEWKSYLLKLKDKSIIKKIKSNDAILNFINWTNKKDKQNYIIQCNENSIIIFCPFLEKCKYNIIKNSDLKGENKSACIVYNKNETDILCISNENGNIIFYDLFKKSIISVIKVKDNKLRQICAYNEKYLIVISQTGFILIIDYNLKKIINKISSKKLKEIKTIKMIKHRIFGEFLLLSGFVMDLIIFKNKNNLD